MTFTESCDYTMPFGKHAGQRFARIGASTDGLRYLDWLIGQEIKDARLREAMEVYLGHPAVAMLVDAAIED